MSSRITTRRSAAGASAVAVFALGLAMPGAALAAKIKNPVAVFSGLDKITGRTTSFDVYIDETIQFGALQVTPRVCYSRDETEAQKVDGFVEVDEIARSGAFSPDGCLPRRPASTRSIIRSMTCG